MDRAVDDDMQIGYNKIVENFIKELENGAIQEAEGFDSRVKRGRLRAYFRRMTTSSQSSKSRTARLPSAVTKRIERLRTRLRERVGDLRKAEVEISEISSIMEDSQADWLARHGDKLEKLIAGRDQR